MVHGLSKLIFVPYELISEIQLGNPYKTSTETLEFIAKDFEIQQPNFILSFKNPIEATLFMGMRKEFERMAIRLDEPERFRMTLEERMKELI